MTEESSTNILVSIISGFFLVLSSVKLKLFSPLLNKIRRFKKKNDEQEFMSSMKEMLHIYEHLEEIVENTSADRIILASGHNCGGLPAVYKPYWISALYGIGVDKKILNNYTNLPIDKHYIECLINSHDKSYVYLNQNSLPEDSQIKKIYDLEGVKECYLFYLTVIENNLLFAKVASKDKEITPCDLTFIELKINFIKNLLH